METLMISGAISLDETALQEIRGGINDIFDTEAISKDNTNSNSNSVPSCSCNCHC